jgi:hypothetical protein
MATLCLNNAARSVILATLLGLAGWAGAAEQQASFAVAITLHAISKPIVARTLCPEAPRLDRLNVAITVSCPGIGQDAIPSVTDAALRKSGLSANAPTVFVSF